MQATLYIFSHMRAYDLSEVKPDKPHWCIGWFNEFLNNKVFLRGEGFERLTKAEAIRKVVELNQKLQGS